MSLVTLWQQVSPSISCSHVGKSIFMSFSATWSMPPSNLEWFQTSFKYWLPSSFSQPKVLRFQSLLDTTCPLLSQGLGMRSLALSAATTLNYIVMNLLKLMVEFYYWFAWFCVWFYFYFSCVLMPLAFSDISLWGYLGASHSHVFV